MHVAQIVALRKVPWRYGVIRSQHSNGLLRVEWSNGGTGNYFPSDLLPV
jgi:hypothetical protein